MAFISSFQKFPRTDAGADDDNVYIRTMRAPPPRLNVTEVDMEFNPLYSAEKVVVQFSDQLDLSQ